MIDLCVVILTYNEEKHIARAIRSVAGLARQIFVVDSGSGDATASLAQAEGAVVLRRRFVNYAQQFQWALDNAPITASWILRLDADEVIDPALGAEIERKLPTLGPETTGVYLKRRHIFMGRWIRHGGRYPLTLLRLVRRGRGRIENRWMDEHLVVDGGGCVEFDEPFSDDNLNDLNFFIEKHNGYASREAIDILRRRYSLGPDVERLSAKGSGAQAARRRWIKLNLYDRLPFGIGPAGYFLYRYILRAGFLDGREGAIYHLLQGFWYRFLVAAKVEEWDRRLRRLDGPQARLRALEHLCGRQLEAALLGPNRAPENGLVISVDGSRQARSETPLAAGGSA